MADRRAAGRARPARVVPSPPVSRRTAERLGLVALLIVLAAVLASATLVDRVPPSVDRIFLTRTAGSDTVALTHAAIGVQFSEPVRRAGAQLRFHVDPALAGTFSWSDDRTLIFTPAQKLPNTTKFTVVEEAGFEDVAGNAAKVTSPALRFATVGAPVLAATEPAAGASGVALDATLAVTFDRLMDTQRTAAAVTIEPSTTLHPSWRGQTLTLVPDTPLLPDTTYRLIVGTQATDTDGNDLVAPAEISFTTIQVGLAIEDVLPADGSAGIAIDAPIGLVFGGPVDPASIGGSLTITPAISGSLAVAVRPDDPPPAGPGPGGSRPNPSGGPSGSPGVSPLPSTGGSPEPSTAAPPSAAPTPSGGPAGANVLLFQPDGPLAPNTTYTVTLRTGAVQGLGSAVAAPGRTWSFTTGGPPEPLQNQILFRSDRGGVENVWAMNPDGTGAHQVTAEIAPVTSFDVSGDGQELAYSVAGVVRVMALPSADVTAVTDPGLAEYGPRLLPDGSAVIVGRRDRITGADEGWWLRPLAGGSGSGRQLIPDGAPPLGSAEGDVELPAQALGPWMPIGAVSGSGRLALLPRADGSLVLVVLAVGPAEPGPAGRVIETGLDQAAGPAAWSATDGGFVIVARRTIDGVAGTWVVHPDGSLAAGPPLAGWAAVAQDGALAGISATAPGHLTVAAGLDAPLSILTTASDFQDREPTFGPGASALVFVRARPASPGDSAGIWTVDIDGRDLRQLSTDGSDPRWLP